MTKINRREVMALASELHKGDDGLSWGQSISLAWKLKRKEKERLEQLEQERAFLDQLVLIIHGKASDIAGQKLFIPAHLAGRTINLAKR